jgi:hypothetical protein
MNLNGWKSNSLWVVIVAALFFSDGYSGKPGSVSLFNGVDLDGCKIDSIETDASTTFFAIENSGLILTAAGSEDYVWLTFDRELTDFVLWLKFRSSYGLPPPKASRKPTSTSETIS